MWFSELKALWEIARWVLRKLKLALRYLTRDDDLRSGVGSGNAGGGGGSGGVYSLIKG
jgi:hypothetical protein